MIFGSVRSVQHGGVSFELQQATNVANNVQITHDGKYIVTGKVALPGIPRTVQSTKALVAISPSDFWTFEDRESFGLVNFPMVPPSIGN
jgi:hypothetical protein